jgi:hypothetical protein
VLKNNRGLYWAFEDWFRDLAVNALRAYGLKGIDAGDEILWEGIRRPASFRRAPRRQAAYSRALWFRALRDGAKPILAAALPQRERAERLCKAVQDVRERYWPIGPGEITPDTLPGARTADGFAKAALGKFFLEGRDDAGRDRRSVGTSLRVSRSIVKAQYPGDWEQIRKGVDELLADPRTPPVKTLVPAGLLFFLSEQ